MSELLASWLQADHVIIGVRRDRRRRVAGVIERNPWTQIHVAALPPAELGGIDATPEAWLSPSTARIARIEARERTQNQIRFGDAARAREASVQTSGTATISARRI
jgi:hypothetical protein